MYILQLVIWFLAYSFTITGTGIAAFFRIRERSRESLIVLKTEASLLLLVLSASLISFSFRLISPESAFLLLVLINLLFFLGVSATAITVPDLPLLFGPRSRPSGTSPAYKVSVLSTFAALTAMNLLLHLLFPGSFILEVLNGILQFLLLIFFTVSSLRALIGVLKYRKPEKRWAERAVLTGGVILITGVFVFDTVIGTWLKLAGGEELNIFILLPFYCIIVSALLTLYLVGVLKSSKRNVEEYREEKLLRAGLSPREREVALLLIHGKSYQEIADALHISLATVQSHIRSIYRKTGTKSKVELANFCTP